MCASRQTGLLLWLLAVLVLGCRASRPREEVDGYTFVRCAALDPPASGSYRLGKLGLTVRERTLEITGAEELRIAAFTGPVGAKLEPADLALLQRAQADLVLYLGGLGDDEKSAQANLTALASLKVATLFLPGGGDRASVVEPSFARLESPAREHVYNASGLHTLQFGGERLVLLPGAPLGRYALDDDGCGLSEADLAERVKSLSSEPARRSWLVSWQAPSGVVPSRAGQVELGNSHIARLSEQLGVLGGLFAYPATHAGEPHESTRGGLVLVLPRLGRVGRERGDGSRLPSALALLRLGRAGLVLAPPAPPAARSDEP